MLKGKFDFKEFEQFAEEINKASEQSELFMEKVTKELAARLLAKVIPRTPTAKSYKDGRSGGTLRRGWTVDTHVEAESGKEVDATTYVNKLVIKKTGKMYEIDIINPVHYAPYVEFGHRTRDHKKWVPGRFMLTISEEELRNEAPKIIEKKVEQYLKEVFK
jgi:Bacteriophage HK97-gp10, putative tail-component